MTLATFLALLVFSFVSSVTPGPNNIMLFASGVNFGLRRTWPHAFGISAGFGVLLVAVGAGVGLVLTTLPQLFMVLKLLGGAYMLYLAWRIANSGPVEEGHSEARPMTFLEAAAFQWVNPKAWVMAVSFGTGVTRPPPCDKSKAALHGGPCSLLPLSTSSPVSMTRKVS